MEERNLLRQHTRTLNATKSFVPLRPNSLKAVEKGGIGEPPLRKLRWTEFEGGRGLRTFLCSILLGRWVFCLGILFSCHTSLRHTSRFSFQSISIIVFIITFFFFVCGCVFVLCLCAAGVQSAPHHCNRSALNC